MSAQKIIAMHHAAQDRADILEGDLREIDILANTLGKLIGGAEAWIFAIELKARDPKERIAAYRAKIAEMTQPAALPDSFKTPAVTDADEADCGKVGETLTRKQEENIRNRHAAFRAGGSTYNDLGGV